MKQKNTTEKNAGEININTTDTTTTTPYCAESQYNRDSYAINDTDTDTDYNKSKYSFEKRGINSC